MTTNISAENLAALNAARRSDGKFGNRPHTESDVTISAPSPSEPLVPVDQRHTEPGHYNRHPLLMIVAPDRHVYKDTYETDWRDGVHVDLAPMLAEDQNLRDQLADIFQDTDDQDLYELGDELAEQTGALEQINVSAGYSVAMADPEPQSVLEWLDDNPVWVQDGTTPHPAGGYTEVQDNRDPETGEGSIAYYDAQGDWHRNDGPAFTVVRDGVQSDLWMSHGKPDRHDGPSLTKIHLKTGSIIAEEWAKDGVMHREDGPAKTESDGSRTWYIDGNQILHQPGASGVAPHLAISTDGRIVHLDGPYA